MIDSINDVYRKQIYEENNEISIYDYLSNLDNKTREYVLRLIISDWYKYIYISEKELFNDIIKNPNKLVEYCKEDLGLLSVSAIYEESSNFFSTTLIQKIIAIEKIDNSYIDDVMQCVNVFHVLDKMTYKFQYNFDSFNEYYIDYLQNSKKNKDFIYEYITDRIRNLFTINMNKYTEYVLKFMREYYKWNFYKSCSLNLDTHNKNQKRYLDMIERYPLNLLIDTSINDVEFLKSMIKDYLYNENFNKEQEKIESKQFLLNNTSEKLQKKLRITKD